MPNTKQLKLKVILIDKGVMILCFPQNYEAGSIKTVNCEHRAGGRWVRQTAIGQPGPRWVAVLNK